MTSSSRAFAPAISGAGGVVVELDRLVIRRSVGLTSVAEEAIGGPYRRRLTAKSDVAAAVKPAGRTAERAEQRARLRRRSTARSIV